MFALTVWKVGIFVVSSFVKTLAKWLLSTSAFPKSSVTRLHGWSFSYVSWVFSGSGNFFLGDTPLKKTIYCVVKFVPALLCIQIKKFGLPIYCFKASSHTDIVPIVKTAAVHHVKFQFFHYAFIFVWDKTVVTGAQWRVYVYFRETLNIFTKYPVLIAGCVWASKSCWLFYIFWKK